MMKSSNTAYFTSSKESGNAKRGLLTICRRDVDSSEIPTPATTAKAETQAVSLEIDSRRYIAVNIYIPCDSMPTADA
jgi:hypothetical protein